MLENQVLSIRLVYFDLIPFPQQDKLIQILLNCVLAALKDF